AADLAEAVRSGDAVACVISSLATTPGGACLVERDRLLHVACGFWTPGGWRELLQAGLCRFRALLVASCCRWIEKQAASAAAAAFRRNGAIQSVDNRGRSAVHAALRIQGELGLSEPPGSGRERRMESARLWRSHARRTLAAGRGPPRYCLNGNQPAHLAARHDRLNCLRLLADRGVALDLPGRAGKLPITFRGNTPGHWTNLSGQAELLRLHSLGPLRDTRCGANPDTHCAAMIVAGHVAPDTAGAIGTWRHPDTMIVAHGRNSWPAIRHVAHWAHPIRAARRAGHPVLMATLSSKPTDNAAKSPSCPLCVEKDRKFGLIFCTTYTW
uniref:ANK_REP_REGION domain-containing protein n=1 Tax=Macrostomum lignano TaxID=282301 RepID=A0A1I8FA79_9PLAT